MHNADYDDADDVGRRRATMTRSNRKKNKQNISALEDYCGRMVGNWFFLTILRPIQLSGTALPARNQQSKSRTIRKTLRMHVEYGKSIQALKTIWMLVTSYTGSHSNRQKQTNIQS